ncbi:mitochondrial ribosomal protein subunit L23 [Phaeosphaeriaceae sp. PMI808]|nr:mitochondrial ribosomal protein subunit L23 [Phaeosphaeriaceae sp. PMI808]
MDIIPITKKLIAFGSKKIYLPKFTVALIKTPDLSPYHARFLVPLDFSKYDLRDYLFHAYNVKCYNIRSFVKQMPIRDTAAQPRHFFRPESKKYMTVEMELPFVWPEQPDLTPWGKKERDDDIKSSVSSYAPGHAEQREGARVLKEQVQRLYKKEREVLDEEIQSKKAKGIALSELEQRAEERRVLREKQWKEMSRVGLWEESRTAKVVGVDDSKHFSVKA